MSRSEVARGHQRQGEQTPAFPGGMQATGCVRVVERLSRAIAQEGLTGGLA
jgi:hypothetical protein